MKERLSIYTIYREKCCRMCIIRNGKKLWDDEVKSSAKRKCNRYLVAVRMIIRGFDTLEHMIFIFGLSLSKSEQYCIKIS